MKVLKVVSSLVGIFVLLFGANSCKKDDECCSFTYGGQTYRYCKDGNEWKEYYDTWEEFVAYVQSYGGTCD